MRVGLCASMLHASAALAFVLAAQGKAVATAGTERIMVLIIELVRIVRASGHIAETASSNYR
ncbi:hypothetical protein AFL94_09205 [Arthrobacter sp. LS16]|nr:hypothetical protein AFL94_09205 [Arthrobacter sp. LS16]